MIVTNGRNMLRNFVKISKAEIKLLQRHISCAQLVNLNQSTSEQDTTFLRKNLISPNYFRAQKIPVMSISTSNTSLIDDFEHSKYSEKSKKNETSTNSEQIINSESYHDYNNKKDLPFDEYAMNNTFPICDKSLPVMPRNTIISATTSMSLQVTTSPRQHYYSTSSIDSDQGRIGNQELHCPECEKM